MRRNPSTDQKKARRRMTKKTGGVIQGDRYILRHDESPFLHGEQTVAPGSITIPAGTVCEIVDGPISTERGTYIVVLTPDRQEYTIDFDANDDAAIDVTGARDDDGPVSRYRDTTGEYHTVTREERPEFEEEHPDAKLLPRSSAVDEMIDFGPRRDRHYDPATGKYVEDALPGDDIVDWEQWRSVHPRHALQGDEKEQAEKLQWLVHGTNAHGAHEQRVVRAPNAETAMTVARVRNAWQAVHKAEPFSLKESSMHTAGADGYAVKRSGFDEPWQELGNVDYDTALRAAHDRIANDPEARNGASPHPVLVKNHFNNSVGVALVTPGYPQSTSVQSHQQFYGRPHPDEGTTAALHTAGVDEEIQQYLSGYVHFNDLSPAAKERAMEVDWPSNRSDEPREASRRTASTHGDIINDHYRNGGTYAVGDKVGDAEIAEVHEPMTVVLKHPNGYTSMHQLPWFTDPERNTQFTDVYKRHNPEAGEGPKFLSSAHTAAEQWFIFGPNSDAQVGGPFGSSAEAQSAMQGMNEPGGDPAYYVGTAMDQSGEDFINDVVEMTRGKGAKVMQNEAALLMRMAKTRDPNELVAFDVELQQLRSERAATITNNGAAQRIASQMVSQVVEPGMVRQQHTAATDWMTENDDPALDEAQRLAAAEASIWYASRSPEVRAYTEELLVQAQGVASRFASRFGEHAPAVEHTFITEVNRTHTASLRPTAVIAVHATCPMCADDLGETEDPQSTVAAHLAEKHKDSAPGNLMSQQGPRATNKDALAPVLPRNARLSQFASHGLTYEGADDTRDEFLFDGSDDDGTTASLQTTAAEMGGTDEYADDFGEDQPLEAAASCPTCKGPGMALGKLGNMAWFRCRNCGSDFNTGRTAADQGSPSWLPGVDDPEQAGEAGSSLPLGVTPDQQAVAYPWTLPADGGVVQHANRRTAIKYGELPTSGPSKKNPDGSITMSRQPQMMCPSCGDGPYSAEKGDYFMQNPKDDVKCGNCGENMALGHHREGFDFDASLKTTANQYVKQQDGKWVITQKGTGKVLSTHDSEEKANSAFRAMESNMHGGSRRTAEADQSGEAVSGLPVGITPAEQPVIWPWEIDATPVNPVTDMNAVPTAYPVTDPAMTQVASRRPFVLGERVPIDDPQHPWTLNPEDEWWIGNFTDKALDENHRFWSSPEGQAAQPNMPGYADATLKMVHDEQQRRKTGARTAQTETGTLPPMGQPPSQMDADPTATSQDAMTPTQTGEPNAMPGAGAGGMMPSGPSGVTDPAQMLTGGLPNFLRGSSRQANTVQPSAAPQMPFTPQPVMYPWALGDEPEQAVGAGTGAADVAGVPTPGWYSGGYPQPTASRTAVYPSGPWYCATCNGQIVGGPETGWRHAGPAESGHGSVMDAEHPAVPKTGSRTAARYTADELDAMDTVHQGQYDDLKLDDGNERVWLSRLTPEDGAPFRRGVTHERLNNGRWEQSDEYEGDASHRASLSAFGERRKLTMPWSEVAMSMGLADKPMEGEHVGHGMVQLYQPGSHEPFSFPITEGESGWNHQPDIERSVQTRRKMGALFVLGVTMERRHLEHLAGTIASAPVDEETRGRLANHMADAVGGMNPQFRRDKFLQFSTSGDYGGGGAARSQGRKVQYQHGHMEAVAGALKSFDTDPDTHKALVQHFGDAIGATNPGFKQDRWDRASNASLHVAADDERYYASDGVPCTNCGRGVDPLSVFPGGLCINCHAKTPEGRRMPTADEVVNMWGGPVRRSGSRRTAGISIGEIAHIQGLNDDQLGALYDEVSNMSPEERAQEEDPDLIEDYVSAIESEMEDRGWAAPGMKTMGSRHTAATYTVETNPAEPGRFYVMRTSGEGDDRHTPGDRQMVGVHDTHEDAEAFANRARQAEGSRRTARDVTFDCKKCGTSMTRYTGQGDVNCPNCGQTHNAFGQRIDYPHGQGEDYAGERWDED